MKYIDLCTVLKSEDERRKSAEPVHGYKYPETAAHMTNNTEKKHLREQLAKEISLVCIAVNKVTWKENAD